jgi:hypothetical protein
VVRKPPAPLVSTSGAGYIYEYAVGAIMLVHLLGHPEDREAQEQQVQAPFGCGNVLDVHPFVRERLLTTGTPSSSLKG